MIRPASLAAILVAGLAGCATGGPDCAQLPTGPEADACWRARVAAVPPGEIAQVAPTAAHIGDPLVRSLAVSAWVRDHGARAPDAQVLALCATLQGVDRAACEKPYRTPHLRP